MNEVIAAVIGVTGALLGSFVGSWMTVRATRQTEEIAHREHRQRECRVAFCEAINALLVYRAREIKRSMDAAETGLTIDEVPSVRAARDARSTCRYHLVVLRVLMPGETIPGRYAELIDAAHAISEFDSQEGILIAADVKRDIEHLAHDFGARQG